MSFRYILFVFFIILFSGCDYLFTGGHHKSIVNATAAGDVKEIRYLIGKGYNINAYNSVGDTAINRAVEALQDYDVVKLLLENGADPNVEGESGFCPLSYAVTDRDYKLVELLLMYGADPNFTEKDGRTPFSYADEKDAKMMGLLNAHSKNGETK